MARRKRTRSKQVAIDQEYIDRRKSQAHPEYPTPMWLRFIQICVNKGLRVDVYEAKTTVSKYITLRSHECPTILKVRFSEHKPTTDNDADIFVGLDPNGRRWSTKSAIRYVGITYGWELPPNQEEVLLTLCS